MLSSASPISTSVNGSPFFVVSAPGEPRFLLFDMLGVENPAAVVVKKILLSRTATCEIGKDLSEHCLNSKPQI